MAAKYQKLVASNLSPDPADELACRVKDPLWFVSRQWQTGEFQAENGGTPAFVSITHADHALTHATVGNRHPLDRTDPLDMVIEDETNGDAPGWRSAALEYEAEVETTRHRLSAREYDGRSLDWWHFDLTGRKSGARTAEETKRMVPTMLNFKGAPHPRWWRLEDGDANFDAPIDPEPNVLSMVLPEFFYTDLDNWFVLPLSQPAGSLREIKSVRVVDSFGVATEMKPAHNSDHGASAWKLFTLSDEGSGVSDGRYLFAPHIAGEVLDNDTLEDIRFIRDEDANLVWAIERLYARPDGTQVHNGDTGVENPGDQTAVPDGFDGVFKLTTGTPDHWIPYVPRFANVGQGAPDGDTYLRRGRTKEGATAADPQFSSVLVGETATLNEEEIASVGIRVRRLNRYSRGSDGVPRHWIARCRDVTDRVNSGSGLKFDVVEKG